MLLSNQSQLSGKITERELDITEEQLKAFMEGELVQNAFPHLSAADREWIRSGITEEEWNELYPEETTTWTMMPPEQAAKHHYQDVWIHQPSGIWLGKWKVIFGYRLRGGQLSKFSTYSYLEICCGGDVRAYDDMFNKIKTIIEANHRRGYHPMLNILPMSDPKPYFNDETFCAFMDNSYQEAKQYLETV